MNNNDVEIGLGLNFDIDAFNAQIEQIFSKTEQGAKAAGNAIVKDAQSSSAKTVSAYQNSARSLDKITADRVNKEKQVHALGFKQLESQYQAHSKRVVDLRTQLSEATLKHASKESIERIKIAKSEEEQLTAIYRKEYQSRPEVERGGAGAKMGILGTGRNIISGAGIGIGRYAGFAGAGLAIGEGLKFSIEKAAEFETAMADLHALTGVAGADLDSLGLKAKELGKEYGTSAKDGVEAFKLVISALGPSIAKDQKALNEMGDDVLKLAKAAGVDAPQAASVLTTALNQFGYGAASSAVQAKEMTRIMNVMAAGAKEGAAEVPDLSEAIKIVGTVAKQAGVSVEGAAGAIEVLSMNGLKGEEAGTSYRNILLGLSAGSKNSAAAMKLLGISFNEINPQINGQEKSLANLKAAYDKLQSPVDKSFVLTHLFGKENIASANILLNNVDALHKMTDAITGTNTAQEQANIKMETTAEMWNRAKENTEELAISLGTVLLPAVNGILTGLNDTVAALFGFEQETDRIQKKYNKEAQDAESTNLADFVRKRSKEKLSPELIRSLGVSYLESYKLTDDVSLSPEQKAALVKQVDEAIALVNAETAKNPLATPGKILSAPGDKAGVAKVKDKFAEQKAIYEDAMNREKTDIELHGIETNESLESIKRKQLEIEIKYDKLIAEAAVKYGQYAGQYLLGAAKDQSAIRQSELTQAKSDYEEAYKSIESIVSNSNENITDDSRASQQQRFENLELGLEQEIYQAKLYGQDTSELERKRVQLIINNDKRLTQQRVADAKTLGELRVAAMKDGDAKEIAQLDEHYRELREANKENLAILKQLDINYAKDLRAITDKAQIELTKGFEDAFGSGMSAAFSEFFRPLNEELSKTKGILGAFFNAFIQGAEQALASEAVKGLMKILFHSKDKTEDKGSSTDFGGILGAILSFLPLADGGIIPMSMGTPGKDSVPALLMPGERVLSVEDNKKTQPFVDAILGGVSVRRYAQGGNVNSGPGVKGIPTTGPAVKDNSDFGGPAVKGIPTTGPAVTDRNLGSTNSMWFDGNSPTLTNRNLGSTGSMWFDGNSPTLTNRGLGSTNSMWFDGNSPTVANRGLGSTNSMWFDGNSPRANIHSYMYQSSYAQRSASQSQSIDPNAIAGPIVAAIRAQKLAIGTSQLYSASNAEKTMHLDYSW